MALRLAHELSYLYGSEDLWQNGQVDDEKVKSFRLKITKAVKITLTNALTLLGIQTVEEM